jgi:tRNA dimethylallyltransferase
VQALLAAGFSAADPGMNATGYPETMRMLNGECDLEQAIDEIQRATRRYARRQLTWFRHQLPADALWLDAERPQAELADTIARFWLTSEGVI